VPFHILGGERCERWAGSRKANGFGVALLAADESSATARAPSAFRSRSAGSRRSLPRQGDRLPDRDRESESGRRTCLQPRMREPRIHRRSTDPHSTVPPLVGLWNRHIGPFRAASPGANRSRHRHGGVAPDRRQAGSHDGQHRREAHRRSGPTRPGPTSQPAAGRNTNSVSFQIIIQLH